MKIVHKDYCFESFVIFGVQKCFSFYIPQKKKEHHMSLEWHEGE